MSATIRPASERLRELDGAMPRAEAPSADSPITTLRFILPLIIAVVEAAERRRDELEGQHPFDDWEQFDLAMAALREALEEK